MIICVCNNITESQIRDAAAQGVYSMAELQSMLAVSTQCGTCFDSAEQVLYECLSSTRANPDLYYNAA